MRLFKRKPLYKYYETPGGEYCSGYEDMLKQPHLLIAGATGSGKSVVVNALMYTALITSLPGNGKNSKQFILIDPKRVELSMYKELPHTLFYASEPAERIRALQYAMQLCENRYKQMQAIKERKYPGGDIYIIIDEFADLMTTQRKETMPLIQRLAQIGRAAKIHIILCTQTPISKILPTEIKCNFDARLGLRTRSAQDSRNILGFAGLETLPRYGKGYYITPNESGLHDLPMYSDEILNKVIDYWMIQKAQKPRRD